MRVSVPLVERDEVDLSELVARLADATGVAIPRPPGDVTLPVTGVSGTLSRKMLVTTLGRSVRIAVEDRSLLLIVEPDALSPAGPVATGSVPSSPSPLTPSGRPGAGRNMACMR